MSRHLSSKVDYVFLTPTEQYNFISSTLIREIASFDGNVSEFVHPSVVAALKARWAERKAGQ
jgi:pantetheine-phosphate adenylyltransferase